jgi:probable addiction module antidote protein
MAIKTKAWDASEPPKTPADIAAYLNVFLKDGTSQEFLEALGNIARSYGMSELSRETGMSRAKLYRTFAHNGDPTFDTITSVMKVLGVKVAVAA